MRRFVRGLAALIVLVGILGGTPLVLLRWGRGLQQLPQLFRPDDGTWLLLVLTVLGWLAWGLFTLATITELVGLMAGVRIRIPALGGLQRASAGLLLAVFALGQGLSLGTTGATPALAPVVVAAAAPDPGAVTEPVVGQRLSPVALVPDTPSYQVVAGDDLWGISERLLGDGTRWRELVASNPEVLKDPLTPLTAGVGLRLPAGTVSPLQTEPELAGTGPGTEAEPRAAKSKQKPRSVIVKRGDTLSGLALTHLGSASRWPQIYQANRDLIADPDQIDIGWRLRLPAASAKPTESRPTAVKPKPEPVEQVSAADASSPVLVSPSPAATPEPEPTSVAEVVAVEPAAVPASSSLPAPSDGNPAASPEQSAPSESPLVALVGSLAAAAMIGVFETRRALRLRERPVGRRLWSPTESDAVLRQGLAGTQRPDRMVALDAALRRIGAHFHDTRTALPGLERVELGANEIGFHWASPPGPAPGGFEVTESRWRLPQSEWDTRAGDEPCPFPALVSLGTTGEGTTVLTDAEHSRVLAVACSEELRRATLVAIGIELACAPWARESRLLVGGDDTEVLALAGGERVQVIEDPQHLLRRVQQVVQERRAGLGDDPLGELRVDPDRAAAVEPVVFLINQTIPATQATLLEDALSGRGCGVVVIIGIESAVTATWQVGGPPDAPSGQLRGRPGALAAHAVPASTREGLAALIKVNTDPGTQPAWWWADPQDNVLPLPRRSPFGEEAVDIIQLLPPPNQPRFLLIGPVDLVGAQGVNPTRSRQQMIELGAWILEHPGRSATEMSSGLSQAEGTRRSNLSRLRAWLGEDETGQAYLPDAYSGRITLHPGVTSDWEELQALLRPGVDRVADATLVAALELVRGAPLADAAPGQWHWAEEMRTDIASALRDVGLVLTDRALQLGDLDLARWAAARALVVAPDDEQLLCARIRTEHRARNRAEVDRLIAQITRQARLLEVDLLPETVELFQQVVEGRLRARQA